MCKIFLDSSLSVGKFEKIGMCLLKLVYLLLCPHQVSPYAAASGSEDGTVRLWDMLTGTCIHKLQGHSLAVTALTCTEMYVVSTGLDDRLCIWERCKGHRIHWIQMVCTI